MVYSQERATGRRLVSLAVVSSSVLFVACGQLTRDFSTSLETAGATATGGHANAGTGGAKSPIDHAGQSGQGGSFAGAASDAGSAGEAGEWAGGSGGSEEAGGAPGYAGAPFGGTNSGGGPGAAGMNGGAGLNSGGTNSGGTNSGGTNSGGTNSLGGSGAIAGGAGSAPIVPPSCVGLEATCGAQATTNCCSAHSVPGGDFNRLNNTTPSYAATVSDFILDDYEITVGRFRKFVAAYNGSGKKPPAAGAGKNPNNASDAGWLESFNASLVGDLAAQVSCGLPYQTWTDNPGANENRPINCLSWFTAEAFCIWDGGRLPTLAEWSYAAVGGKQQRYYPWSSPPNDTTISSNNASYDCLGDGTTGCALTDLLRVGSKNDGLGRWLQADLGGNVSEWVLDWYIDTPPSPCKDCANFDPGSGTGKFRQIMGGSFEKNAFNQQNGGASSTQPVNTMYMVGARCARN